MASGYTTSTALTELVPEITLEAAYIYQDRAIAKGLVNYKDVSNEPGLTVEYPRWTEVDGSTGVAETATPTSHAMDLTMPTLTLARRSVLVQLGDVAKKGASKYDIVNGIAKAMAMAQAKQDDALAFSVVTGTTNWTTATGATNAAFGLGFLTDGILLLEKNEIEDQLICVVHPHQYDAVRDELTPVTSGTTDARRGLAVPQAGEMLMRGFVGELLGATIFKSNRIGSGTVNATANVYNGLLFPLGEGVGFAYSSLEVDGVEFERDAKNAVTDMIINYMSTAGVVYSSAVCKLYSTSG